MAEYAFLKDCTAAPELERIINDNKVTDHHAILPTVEIARTDLSALPAGEKRRTCASFCPFTVCDFSGLLFEAIAATLEAAGHTFTAKGKQFCMRAGKGLILLFVQD